MIRSMSCLLVASLLAVTVSSATTSTQTGADLVSVILASIKGRNEMDSVARYLEMSRDALAKELPLESSGKNRFAFELKSCLTLFNCCLAVAAEIIFDCSEL